MANFVFLDLAALPPPPGMIHARFENRAPGGVQLVNPRAKKTQQRFEFLLLKGILVPGVRMYVHDLFCHCTHTRHME